MVLLLHDRVQNAIVAALNDIIFPRVEMDVKSNQYGSSRTQRARSI